MTPPPAAEPWLAVVGAGGHGLVVAEAAQAQGQWRSVAFFDDAGDARRLGTFALHGTVADLRRLAGSNEAPQVVVAIGNNQLRSDLSIELESLGFQLATVIHPSAVISPSVKLGAGTVVLAGVVVNGRTRVGRACILNTRCSVDHDNVLEDSVHVSPGAALAGGVTLGCCAWVGIGAAVIQGISIGAHARIGAGSAVIRDIPPGVTAVGCPAHVKSHR